MEKPEEYLAYKYLPMLSMLFVTCFLTGTVLSHRMIAIGGFELTGGILIYPGTFFLGDVITEVYGSERCNGIIYMTLICAGIFGFMCHIIMSMPSPTSWHNMPAYITVFRDLPRFCFSAIIGSLFGYWVNNYVLLKIKDITNGKHLWLRTIAATSVGEAVFTTVVVFMSYGDILNDSQQVMVIISLYGFKVIYEIVATPFTYLLVNFLKKRDRINIFEKYENIDPYTLELKSDNVIKLK